MVHIVLDRCDVTHGTECLPIACTMKVWLPRGKLLTEYIFTL
jgi:hypothetical protein